MKIEWEVCARVVAQEVRRLRGHLIGGWISSEDLSQELSITAWKSARKHDGRDGEAYIRKSVRNAIRTLYERVYAAKRYPQNKYGQPISLLSYDNIVPQAVGGSSPEQCCWQREVLKLIADQLDSEDRAQLMAFANGEKEIDLKFARRIRRKIDLSSM